MQGNKCAGISPGDLVLVYDPSAAKLLSEMVAEESSFAAVRHRKHLQIISVDLTRVQLHAEFTKLSEHEESVGLQQQ